MITVEDKIFTWKKERTKTEHGEEKLRLKKNAYAHKVMNLDSVRNSGVVKSIKHCKN